ncbi:hypothetical protein X770_21095 [Mesorhizobium sp. LSJC269B00]|nr:hypothetical protein X770_21095 [Mesorhizobium sp. LSJC269B00]
MAVQMLMPRAFEIALSISTFTLGSVCLKNLSATSMEIGNSDAPPSSKIAGEVNSSASSAPSAL